LLIRRKADYASTPADIGAAVDERIEHQRQKLIGQLKHRALAPVAASPSSWVSALPSAPPVKPKILAKFGGSAAAIVEEVIDRPGDVLLVLIEIATGAEIGGRGQEHVGRGVA
jgi:hypothetical protein